MLAISATLMHKLEIIIVAIIVMQFEMILYMACKPRR